MGRILIFACVLGVAAPAAAWDPFLVTNEHVDDGNERMSAEDAENALRHYDQAARQLPNEAGVQLNRGLALLEAGELDGALEAFERASEPSVPRELRADAYYDTGLVHYQLGDAAATEENHEEAQRLFREAADAFRRSLRMRPGNADAGWNLELALRRIREQEEQQEQEEQEQQDQEDQEQQDQEDQEEQDQEEDQEGGDQEEDQEGGDQEEQDQEGGDQEEQDQEGGDQEEQDQEGGDQEEQDQEGGDQESDQEESSQEQEGSQDGDSPQEQEPQEQEPEEAGGTEERSLPPEHRRVLDALRDGEENLQRHRARARGDRERRRVEQDW